MHTGFSGPFEHLVRHCGPWELEFASDMDSESFGDIVKPLTL